MLKQNVKLQDLFTHRQHSEGARFIAPRKTQCSESYRVQDNGRTINVLLRSSDPQERRGSNHGHRWQLKLPADMRIKRRSLDNQKYFLV